MPVIVHDHATQLRRNAADRERADKASKRFDYLNGLHFVGVLLAILVLGAASAEAFKSGDNIPLYVVAGLEMVLLVCDLMTIRLIDGLSDDNEALIRLLIAEASQKTDDLIRVHDEVRRAAEAALRIQVPQAAPAVANRS